MNDIILSSLIHLFVLFGAKNGLKSNEAQNLMAEYLTRFFGIRNLSSYMHLYETLTDFYADDTDTDKDAIVESICDKIKTKIRPEEKVTLLLRLMEFCSRETESFSPEEPIFHKVAELFGISAEEYADLAAYIKGEPDENILVVPLAGGECSIKTLFLRKLNILIVTHLGAHTLWMDDIRMMPGVFQVWNQSSLIKSSHFQPIYYSSIMAMYSGIETPKIELCGRDINFRFEQGGDNGMHNLSFTLKSGELVAIMGGSGVGKSTLLSLLNGNLKPQSGTITINGHSIDEPEAKSLIGFVPQDDLLIEELTVYQNLWYTAKLCFEGMTDEDIDAKVMDVLTQLGLDAARDLKVGSPINKFISGGQRKRLNIALELIREPAVLFLDEPTSGLSSTDTEKVVLILKELTNRGKLIVVNIHQPSSDVFKLFDRLWLLDKGGYPIYDGNPIEAISAFKTAANFADPRTSACPTCGNVNPEIILNIVDDKLFDNTGKLTDKRKMSPKDWHELYLKHRPAMAAPNVSEVPPTDQKRPGWFKQMWIFLRRNVSAKITNVQYLLVTALEAPLLAVICALLTHFTPDSGIYTLMDNKNFPSYIFMAIIVSIFMGMSGSAEEIIKDRAILKREKFLSLSYTSYIASKIIYMAAVCLVQTVLFIAVGNLIIGVHGMFFEWWAVLFMSAFLSALIGLLLSQCLNSVVTIYITIPLLLIPQILLCGLVVKFEDLNPRSETGNVPLIGEVIPSRWSYEALAVATYSMNDYERQFFDKDRERFEALYYDRSYIYELESQLETRLSDSQNGEPEDPQHMAVLRNGMNRLSEICGIEPYSGDESYDSIREYLDRARKTLRDRSNKVTLALDDETMACVNEHGRDYLTNLKVRNFNVQMENLVVNRDTETACKVVGSSIVPRTGYIFLTPRGRCGRAQFYSGVKRLGNCEISTFYYNLSVLLLMCLLVGICLFLDVPGKYVRKERS